jgi:hypothetical protein
VTLGRVSYRTFLHSKHPADLLGMATGNPIQLRGFDGGSSGWLCSRMGQRESSSQRSGVAGCHCCPRGADKEDGDNGRAEDWQAARSDRAEQAPSYSTPPNRPYLYETSTLAAFRLQSRGPQFREGSRSAVAITRPIRTLLRTPRCCAD